MLIIYITGYFLAYLCFLNLSKDYAQENLIAGVILCILSWLLVAIWLLTSIQHIPYISKKSTKINHHDSLKVNKTENIFC